MSTKATNTTTSSARIYMAGPIQHSPDLGVGWRETIAEEFDHVEWVNPLAKYHAPLEEIKWPCEKVVEEDLAMIDSSDAVYVGWEEVPSAGTAMEVRYAYDRGMPVAVCFDDPDNISPWMEYHANIVHESPEVCVSYLNNAVTKL